MMTQSVMTQAANLLGNAAGSVTTKGKQSGSGFDLIIQSNMKTVQNMNGSTGKFTTEKTSLKSIDTKTSKKSDVTDQATKQTTENTKDVTAKEPVKTEGKKPVKQTDQKTENSTRPETVEKTDDTEIAKDEQVIAQITGMLQAIYETDE